ncbi:TCP-1/cpn60 chaperonin family protein [Acuticoccus kandeliae]|uniref:TCP-1/cpn60 chaperonin family protein n=1 Tax=Acuticoccus kandeliae TaxID=2073160 RepID=UPI0013005F66|nr:TCP-1/cpn60 chaperonin family protein [Acuticoccus kandeliae]
MNSRIIRLEERARAPIARGIDLVADTVATTIGPCGRAVLSGRPNRVPEWISGGYAIAKALEDDAPGKRSGIVAMRELAWRTAQTVGDGTATAILIARALLRNGEKAILAGHAPTELRREMEREARAVIDALLAAAEPAEAADFLAIATRAAGGDAALGALIAEAAATAGPNGAVTIARALTERDESVHEPGMHFETSWASPHLATDPGARESVVEAPLVLLYGGIIETFSSLARVLEMIAGAGKSLLIVADAYGDEAIGTLVQNRKAGLAVAAARAPGAGLWKARYLEDIAAATGASVIAPHLGTTLEGLRPSMLGRAGRARVTARGLTIIEGGGEPAAAARYAEGLRLTMEAETSLSLDREKHAERLARFTGGIVEVRIGGRDKREQDARKAQAERALSAVRAARREGIAPGGAAAYIRAAHAGGSGDASDAAALARRVLAGALAAPTAAIAANAGLDGRAVARSLAEAPRDLAFDVEQRCMAPARTLAEPVAVLTAALRGATSTATTLMGVAASISMYSE